MVPYGRWRTFPNAILADLSSDFLIGLGNRMFIPVLTHPLAEVVERWPWDVIVDARAPGERRP
jgi:xanthine dehydrogenase accessory factor